jgi:tRNA dimethylallyltransferase
MKNKPHKLITILGCTATGKTQLAAHLAAVIDSEIISADSRQVFRGMDIGTGKDLDDYVVEGKQIPYHLIDIADAGSEYSLFQFQQDFIKAFNQIITKGKTPILCGGTGLYLNSIFNKYFIPNVPEDDALRKTLSRKTDEDLINILKSFGPLHNKTDITDRERLIRAIEINEYKRSKSNASDDFPEIEHHIFRLQLPREIIRERITHRLKARLQNGMIEEVKRILDSGVSNERLMRYGLEYRYVTQFVCRKITYDEMFRLLNIAIHQFAKRQMTWFRKMERQGVNIKWVDGMLGIEEKIKIIASIL